MMKTATLLVLSILAVAASGFLFYQRSQVAAEATSLRQECETLERKMNDEIQRTGQASEDTRSKWINMGNDKARAEFSAWKSGIYSLGCLTIAIVTGVLGIVWWRRNRSSKQSE